MNENKLKWGTYIRMNELKGGGGRTYERTNLEGDVHTNEPSKLGADNLEAKARMAKARCMFIF